MKLSSALVLLSSTVLSTSVRGQISTAKVCTFADPCGECQADCTRDSDCAGELVCFHQLGKSLDRDPIPGCSIVDFSKSDYCVDKKNIPDDYEGPGMKPQEEDKLVAEDLVNTGETLIGAAKCRSGGLQMFPFVGEDSSQRLLKREGVISEIPSNLCAMKDDPNRKGRKNVILVVGDGMGWEMARAGAITRQVLDELKSLGCNTMEGCPDNQEAIDAFKGRQLQDYYTAGYGSGLSFQELSSKILVTTTPPVLQEATPGNHYAPGRTLLEGESSQHSDRQADLALNTCGFPLEFNPNDVRDGGHMAFWDDVKGGEFPWDANYYTETPDLSSGFDPTFIMQHATDSAATASAFATGVKMARGQLSQNLYEREVETILEEAIKCGMSGGVVSSVPMFHATPAAFIIHSNNRSNRDQLRTSWKLTNPTLVMGTCASRYYPFPEDVQSMINGTMSDSWTLLTQNEETLAEDFYNDIGDLDPDNGDHLMVCLGGDFTKSGQSNMPYRGVDSTYSNRHCSSGETIKDPDTGLPIGVNVTTSEETCNHYELDEIEHIPTIMQNVEAALDFLSKDDDGFFMMYEQGDIDWAAHGDHLDDMLGTMLDIDDSVRIIMDWIEENGGWNKNALYVTADHDHYLTLSDHFPEALAKLLIAGESHKITPLNNTNKNAYSEAINAECHLDPTKTVTECLNEYSTWTEEDLEMVAHFWGPRGAGGNGWGSHSARPVPLYYQGDNGCIEELKGAGYRVVGKEVKGAPGKIDQVHIHACMFKNLFGLN